MAVILFFCSSRKPEKKIKDQERKRAQQQGAELVQVFFNGIGERIDEEIYQSEKDEDRYGYQVEIAPYSFQPGVICKRPCPVADQGDEAQCGKDGCIADVPVGE